MRIVDTAAGESNEARFINNVRTSQEVWVVPIKGKAIKVVYDFETAMIVTVLPMIRWGNAP